MSAVVFNISKKKENAYKRILIVSIKQNTIFTEMLSSYRNSSDD